jgi:carboxyvinyl-carboxyphosphonate phosphorylmutase
MRYTEQRNKLRRLLAGSECLLPAGVFDALTARVAEDVGYEIGIFAGSEASRTILGAPNLNLLTLTEFADQVRRITRVSNLSLIVDADDGFGSALNAMRTIQEMEHAGASAVMIEDIALRFGKPEGAEELISIEEMVGKLRAAIAGREDPALVVIGRTRALKGEDLEHAVARARAYKAAGVDAIFLSGPSRIEEIEAVHEAVKLPIISGSVPSDARVEDKFPGRTETLTRDEMARRGVRVVLKGHHEAVEASVKAVREVYTHLLNGGSLAELKDKVATPQEMDRLGLNFRADARYRKMQDEYMR